MSLTTTPPLPATVSVSPAPSSSMTDVINTYGRIFVSGIVLIAFGFVTVWSMLKTVTSSPETTQIIGILDTLATVVVSYWVGSSASSTKHSESLDRQLAAVTPPGPVPPGSTVTVETPAKSTVTTAEGTTVTTPATTST